MFCRQHQGNPPCLEGGTSGANHGAAFSEDLVLVVMIINEFILGLDVLHTYAVFMDVEQCMLQLDKQEVLLQRLGL
jgi:hypothetical protein